jgi:hypothetical protein
MPQIPFSIHHVIIIVSISTAAAVRNHGGH